MITDVTNPLASNVLLPIGTRVEVGTDSRKGTVVAHYIVTRWKDTFPLYVVELDKGFYDELKTTFVTLLSAHRNSLTLLED